MMRVLVSVWLMVFASVSVAKEYSGVLKLHNIDSPFESVAYMDKEVSLNFDIQINWKLWTLMGEPVVDSNARWVFNSVTVRQGFDKQTYHYCGGDKGYRCLPASVIKDIALVDVEFLARAGNYADKITYGMMLNPGVNSAPALSDFADAKPSYNVPGSPGWDKTFVSHHGHHTARIDLNQAPSIPEYLDEETAQRILKQKVTLRHLALTKFSAAYSALFDYLNQQDANKQARELQRKGAERQTDRLRKVRNEVQDDIFADFEADLITDEADQVLETQIGEVERIQKQNRRLIDKLKRQEQKEIAAVRARVNSHSLPGEKLVTFREGGVWGYKNTRGEIVISPRFRSVSDFSEGLAAVQVDTSNSSRYADYQWGYINLKGEFVIKAQFDRASPFTDGEAKVEFDQYYKGRCSKRTRYWKSATIDKSGRYVVSPRSRKSVVGELCLTLDKQ